MRPAFSPHSLYRLQFSRQLVSSIRSAECICSNIEDVTYSIVWKLECSVSLPEKSLVWVLQVNLKAAALQLVRIRK